MEVTQVMPIMHLKCERRQWHFLMSGIAMKEPWNIHWVSPGTHVLSASTLSHAVLTTGLQGNTDSFHESILTGLSINLQRFKQKIQWKALEWPASPREINATRSIPGSDYKGQIVFQITHLPLRFSQTIQVPQTDTKMFSETILRDLS